MGCPMILYVRAAVCALVVAEVEVLRDDPVEGPGSGHRGHVGGALALELGHGDPADVDGQRHGAAQCHQADPDHGCDTPSPRILSEERPWPCCPFRLQGPGPGNGETDRVSERQRGHQLASLSIIETTFSGIGLGRMPKVVGMTGT